VKKTRKSAFDPKIFFAKVGEYRNIRRIRLFCHRVTLRTFYAQKDKIKLTIVSERGKEAVVRISEPMHFF
jgi:CRP/FNR family transcriptional regulator, cyclic AMP receptor protein